jgi:hypothetical protein
MILYKLENMLARLFTVTRLFTIECSVFQEHTTVRTVSSRTVCRQLYSRYCMSVSVDKKTRCACGTLHAKLRAGVEVR